MKTNHKHHVISLIFFIITLVIWQILSSFPKVEFFFGSPMLIYESIIQNLNLLLADSLITALETIIGFVIGATLGTSSGFLLWYSPFIATTTKPFILIASTIPAFALAPIIILWFGIGLTMKIILAAFGVYLITLTQSYEGAKTISKNIHQSMTIFGASRSQILHKAIFPASISWVISSMKLSVGIALLGAFIGEFISANQGLGYFILKAGSLYNIPAVFAGALFLIILSIFMNYLVSLMEKHKFAFIKTLTVNRQIQQNSPTKKECLSILWHQSSGDWI